MRRAIRHGGGMARRACGRLQQTGDETGAPWSDATLGAGTFEANGPATR